jgi:excisionase family DNA binding protein
MNQKYVTIKEAAKYLGVSPLTLRNWDKKGLLQAARHPINNYRVYSIADLENFIKRIESGKPKKLKITFIEE